MLELGNCGAECHLDAGLPPDRPEAWLVQPDERRIAAVAEGYRAHRVPAAAERELLAGVVRLGRWPTMSVVVRGPKSSRIIEQPPGLVAGAGGGTAGAASAGVSIRRGGVRPRVDGAGEASGAGVGETAGGLAAPGAP